MDEKPRSDHGDRPLDLETVPEANIGPSNLTRAADVTGSYMWLITLICLLIAVGLAWWSLPENGITIDIHFPEGHGLEAEDVVRFRGIDVGIVEEVKLNTDLSGVDVRVNLKPFAQSLAREGTRFWIVRPELSLAGISGLDTAVGHKYIGLIPGDPVAPRRRSFEGLPTSPPDALANDGMEIMIRGEKKYSISAGSPVTCRGVEIGRILSVGLSQDARFVDVRARIFEKYCRLVTTKSKFWATSGVDFDFSFGEGVRLDMESLETIARGGVSMLTIESGGQHVKPGHPFTLYQKPEENWYEAARMVSTAQVELQGVLPLEILWQHNGLLGASRKQQTFNGIPFRDRAGKTFVLIPSDILRLPNRGEPGSMQIAPVGHDEKAIPVTELPAEKDSDSSENDDAESTPYRVLKLGVPDDFSMSWVGENATRTPEVIEDGLAVRASETNNRLTYLHYPIEKLDITVTDQGWDLNSFDGDRDVWHGSPVLSATDGKVIGVLLIDDRQATIVLSDQQILGNSVTEK